MGVVRGLDVKGLVKLLIVTVNLLAAHSPISYADQSGMKSLLHVFPVEVLVRLVFYADVDFLSPLR